MTPEEAKQIPAIVPLEFVVEYEEKRSAKGDVIPGEYNPGEKVRWAKKGMQNGSETVEKVARLQKHDKIVWSVLEPYYAAWKRNEEMPVNGVPVDALPFISKQLAKVLKSAHILSAEDFVATPESLLHKLGIPGILGFKAKCQTFLDAKKNEAIIVAQMAGKDEQINAMAQQIADLTEAVKQLSAGRPKREKPGDIAKEAA
jgi:hypothetical protein